MRLVKQSAELIKQEPGYEGLLRHIERCGRVCYKSEDKITEGSAEKFVEMIIKNGHHSVLEHGQIIAPNDHETNVHEPYVREEEDYCVTNLRYYLEQISRSLTDAETEFGIIPQTPFRKKDARVTFHVITSRAILDELLRHRTLSASVESTRYCNYTKGKFGGELTFVTSEDTAYMEDVYANIEATYRRLTKQGIKPQRARDILPLSIKSEAYLTAFVDDWVDIFHKRITPAAHPDMVELATMMRYELFKNKYITFEDVTKLEV